jgi:osmotically-inducible protein OsmY
MRKYGKLLLVLGVIAANPVVASADGFLGGRGKPQTPFSGSAEKVRNQAKADEVASALKSGNVQGTDIEIEVKDGVAIISGKVHEASQRALVQQLASSVPGITRVENNLRFVPPAGGGVERAAASRSADSRNPIQRVSGEAPAAGQDNTAVANQIAASLSQVGLVGYDVEIRFNNGTATLSGEVATVGQRQAAGAAASQTPGVRSVNNQLKVTGPISQTGFQPQGIPGGSPEMMQMQGQGMPPQLMGPGMPQQMMGPGMPPQMMGQGMPPQMMQQAGYMQPGMNPGMNPTPSGYAPTSFNNPNLPSHAWPSYAQYPNSAAVSYPTQYSASAFPYIGPFYPYPQVPMGWREVSLEWDDGQWNLNFNKEKDKWYWVLHPKNW